MMISGNPDHARIVHFLWKCPRCSWESPDTRRYKAMVREAAREMPGGIISSSLSRNFQVILRPVYMI